MNIWHAILISISMNCLVPAWAFAQERSSEWGWGMHPMGWMGGVWGIGMMYDVVLLDSGHCRSRGWDSLAAESGQRGAERFGVGNFAAAVRARGNQ
jgi:hypothetical protein